MKTGHRDRVLHFLMRFARPMILQYFRPDSCIASTRIGLDVLQHFKIAAKPEVVKVAAYTAPLLERMEADTFDGTFRPGEHSIGIGYGPPPGVKPGSWDAHLVIVAPHADGETLIDLSLDNASRPDKGLPLNPAMMELPPVWRVVSCAVPYMDNWIIYLPREAPTDYQQSKDWWVKSRRAEVVGRIIEKMETALKGNESVGYIRALEKKCPTCPFHAAGYTNVRPLLEARAMFEGTPVCHSTGDSDVCPKEQKICAEPRACRGARDLQLKMFVDAGFLKEPTDDAWEAKVKELGL